MSRRNPSLSAGWRVVALLVLAAEAAVAAAGDEGLPQPTEALKDPNAAPEQGLVQSLLGPRTEGEYFTPFSLMQPSFPANTPKLKIGQLDHMQVFMGFQAEMRFQDLVQGDVYSGGMREPRLSSGFQTPFGDLSFLARLGDVMEVYYDLYLASRPHPSTTYGHEGYLIFHRMPGSLGENSLIQKFFDIADVKVGAFDIDFGDSRYRRSNNARVQYNPLIGNYVVDPETEEIGVEVYSKPTRLNWLVALTNGTTTGHVDRSNGYGVHGKLWGQVTPDLRAALSGYRADHSASGTGTAASGEKSFLFSNSRSGGPYDGVIAGGDAPGQILPATGKDVTALQGDLTWNHWPYEAYGNLGWTRDSDTNGSAPGSPEERWYYGAAQGVYHLTADLYAAAQYSAAFAGKINNVSSDGVVQRIQVGGGYWFTRTMLAKLEYVYQWYHDFTPAGGQVGGIDVWRGPSFNGVILEASFSF
jgi:hypothetical protein